MNSKNEYSFNLLNIDLPPFLTNDEEKKLLEKFDEQSKKNLIENNLRLVLLVTKRFQNLNFELEDLFSIGTIGLIKAVNTFNPHKNIKLSTYAVRCIENEILLYNRKNQKTNDISMEKVIYINDFGQEIFIKDILHTGDNIVYESASYEMLFISLVNFIRENFNKRDQMIFELRYIYNLTQQQIEKKLNISQSRVSRIDRNLKRKIKEYLTENL